MNKQVTDKLREQVSALVDGELPDGEHELLLRRFSVERSLSLHWERCHLIGEAMRKDLPAADIRGFADRLMAALADEPQPQEETSRFGGLWTRAFAGAAVAATVAVVAIVGLRHDPHQGVNPSEIVPGSIVAGQTSPLGSDYLNSANWDGTLPPLQAAMHTGIMDQDDTGGSLTQQGMQPYRYIARPSRHQKDDGKPDEAEKPAQDPNPPRQP